MLVHAGKKKSKNLLNISIELQKVYKIKENYLMVKKNNSERVCMLKISDQSILLIKSFIT